MFCKWCGKTIRITDVNCPNCGRETPPMSDCGGFYNLKTPDVVIPKGGEGTSPVAVNCPVIEKLESKYMRDRKADKAHHKLTILFFGIVAVLIALSLVLGILAVVKTGEVMQKISQIQEDMDGTAELPQEEIQPEEVVPEPPTNAVPEETVPEETVPEETVPEETVPEETEPVNETDGVIVSEETNELGETVFKVQYNNDIELFNDGTTNYLWQYSKEADIWQNVDEDLFQLNEDGTSVLVCTEAFLEGIDAQEQKIELCCVIKCRNESGDTLEICVRGMFVEELTDTAIDENVELETTEVNNIEQ